jgi:SAM-dependent methyltransferase
MKTQIDKPARASTSAGRLIKELSSILGYKLKRATRSFGGSPYTREYFLEQRAVGRCAAEIVVPRLMELAAPTSVVDVGCGSGSWLSVFRDRGVEDIVGIDSEAVPADVLAVPAATVIRHDLTRLLTLNRAFDLVLCLEVVEHIPPWAGERVIALLTSLSPLVVFSAAIPGQGGTSHVNEQWPEYWAERFDDHGYVPIDCLRRKIWNEPAVAWWYAQNMLLFANSTALEDKPKLRSELDLMGTSQLSLVHPRLYESWSNAVRRTFRP